MTAPAGQDKSREIEFFDAHAAAGEYNVFAPATSRRLIRATLALGGVRPPGVVADLGCASGAFSALVRDEGFDVIGMDISPGLIELARKLNPGIRFETADIERVPLPDASVDAVLLGGVIHHFPDPSRCLAEAHRILKPGGRLVAFDPNRWHPVMYLYRDRSSPFYSAKGVTPNERPVLATAVAAALRRAGFDVFIDYLGGLKYEYLASPLMRRLLPLYNAADAVLTGPFFMRRMRSFVLTAGVKRDGPGVRLAAPPPPPVR